MKLAMTRRRTLIIALAVVAAAIALAVGWRVLSPGERANPSWEEYPIRGIDISAHNGEVDFDAVAAAGYKFVLIKATEGSTWKDSRFNANIWRARKAGLKVGAYHFFRFDTPGYMQALNFLHSLRGQQLDLPVVIDVEQWTNPTTHTTPRVIQTLNILIRKLERQGYSVMIYSNKDGYDEFVAHRFADQPLWICSFTKLPEGLPWVLWQYTHSGSVDGVDGRVDIDVFNGSEEQWERWCANHTHIIQ